MMIMGNIIIIVQEKIVYYLSIYECKKQELDKNKIFPNYALKIINNQWQKIYIKLLQWHLQVTLMAIESSYSIIFQATYCK